MYGPGPPSNPNSNFRVVQVSDELASKPVALECPKTGRTLVCYAERIAVVGGERYLVAFPKVSIGFFDRATALVPTLTVLKSKKSQHCGSYTT